MNNDDFDFDFATRRVLFGKRQEKIPGHGRSAAEAPRKHVKIKVTLNFDGDIVEYFKHRAKEEGRSYQVLINDALRNFIHGNTSEKLAREVGHILLNDPSFYERIQEGMQRYLETKDEE